MATPVDGFLAGIAAPQGGERPQVCLVHGDLVLAVPAAQRIAAALAAAAGGPPGGFETHRRPPSSTQAGSSPTGRSGGPA